MSSSPRIGTTPYIDRNPERIYVYNSNYTEFGILVDRSQVPWLVEINGRPMGSYATHAEAIQRAEQAAA